MIIFVQATNPGFPMPIDPSTLLEAGMELMSRVTIGADGEQLVTVVVPFTVDNAGVGQIIIQ